MGLHAVRLTCKLPTKSVMATPVISDMCKIQEASIRVGVRILCRHNFEHN